MVFVATLAIVLSVFGGFGATAHAAPKSAQYIECADVQQYNDLEHASNGPVALYNSLGNYFADEYVHIDAEVDIHTNATCSLRARADVFPISGNYFGEKVKTELCLAPQAKGTANVCYEGGNDGIVSGSGTSYTCPNVAYPNHCAIVGPWVSLTSSQMSAVTCSNIYDLLDAEAKPDGTYRDTSSVTSETCF